MSGACCCDREPSRFDRVRWWFRRKWRIIRGDHKPENSNLYKWSKAELDRMLVGCEEAEGKDGLDMQIAINKDMLDIIKVFCTQGHSGSSAGYLIPRVARLLNWKPLTSLTGEDSEWNEPYGDRGTQQNRRCSAVFRQNKDNSTAYYIDGKVFSDNGGHSWFSRGGSSTPVIFPFWVPDKPEKVYLNGRDSDEIITDPVRIQELYDEWGKIV